MANNINNNSLCHQDLQQFLGVLVGPRDLEDPKNTKLSQQTTSMSASYRLTTMVYNYTQVQNTNLNQYTHSWARRSWWSFNQHAL